MNKIASVLLSGFVLLTLACEQAASESLAPSTLSANFAKFHDPDGYLIVQGVNGQIYERRNAYKRIGHSVLSEWLPRATPCAFL